MSRPQWNPEEQVELISQMILQTKVNFKVHSFHLMLWGVIISIGCFVQFVLLSRGFRFHFSWVWIMILPGVVISTIYGFKQAHKMIHTTFADQINKWIWISHGVGCIMISSMLMTSGVKVIPVLLVLGGMACFVSGRIIDFKPLEIGGLSLWVFAVICHVVENQYSLLLMGIAIIMGYVVPGIMLYYKKSSPHV